jgi:hypothetical protein
LGLARRLAGACQRLGAAQGVDQGGLPRVGPAREGDLRKTILGETGEIGGRGDELGGEEFHQGKRKKEKGKSGNTNEGEKNGEDNGIGKSESICGLRYVKMLIRCFAFRVHPCVHFFLFPFS